MKNWHNVKIVSTGGMGKNAQIFLDDIPLIGVAKVEVVIAARDVNQVLITLFADTVTVEAPMLVETEVA